MGCSPNELIFLCWSILMMTSTSLLKYIMQVTGSSFTSFRLMAFSSFKESVTPVSPCNLQRIWSRCDQRTSDALYIKNMAGLPSCLIMANTSCLHCSQYCTVSGMDLRKDKFFPMQDSRYSFSSIILLMMCSFSPTHLKVAYNPSLTLSRSIS
jgi:hypothetical protein